MGNSNSTARFARAAEAAGRELDRAAQGARRAARLDRVQRAWLRELSSRSTAVRDQLAARGGRGT